MGVQAIPKDDSYVLEWEALQVSGATDFGTIRKMVKNTQWVVQMVLDGPADEPVTLFTFSTMHPTGMEQWHSYPGDWVVRSPHGRFWFMSDSEFKSQFVWKP